MMFVTRLQILGTALCAFRQFASTPLASASIMVRTLLDSFSLVGLVIAFVAIGLAYHLTTTIDFGFISWVFPQTESKNNDWKSATSIYDFTAKDIHGQEVSLEKYRGHVAIIVNVASECGLTASNYKQLVELYDKYSETKGLRILAFPCNQFNHQEPGDNESIVCFAAKRNVKFDMFEKINVNGDDAHPLWKFLKSRKGGTLGDFIKWNFTKFIIDKEGQPVERFAPTTEPEKMLSTLEKLWN